MTEQRTQPGQSGPGQGTPGPAGSFLREQQLLTGADAAGAAPPGTPAQGGSAAPGSGGGTASASPAASPEAQALQQVVGLVEKMNKRLDHQASYMQRLDGTLKQTRTDFEQRFSGGGAAPEGGQTPGQASGEDPPPFDAKKFANQAMGQMIPAIKEYLQEYLGPVVAQTRINTAAQKVAAAQHDPAIAKLVAELPPQVRATLADEVHRRLGDAMFEEQDALYDAPDPVAEAIELIHFKSVVKAGYVPQTRAADEQTTQPGAPQGAPGLSPVPATGTHSEPPTKTKDQEETEQMYGIKIGPNSMQYPAGVEGELRSAGV